MSDNPMPARGHVARSIAAGKRPFFTCTVSGATFRAIDRLATLEHTSRGRLIDRLVAEAAAALPEAAPLPQCPVCTSPDPRGIAGALLCDRCWQARLAVRPTRAAAAAATRTPPEARAAGESLV